MAFHRYMNTALALGLIVLLAACGGGRGSSSGLFGGRSTAADAPQIGEVLAPQESKAHMSGVNATRGRISDLFRKQDDPSTVVKVNKYIWNASLDVLNFLPIESVDPFTGVIVTGYGTAPGGGRAYRATIYVQDAALDARSLKLAMQTKGGGSVAPETIKAVEDAILSRARQLRIADSKL
ncbi:MAG: DUF3576 domain-containing protein [Paracoccaceae bacterium]